MEKYLYSGKDELENSGQCLINYYKHVVNIIYQSFKCKGEKILDFGAGIGTLSLIYENISGIRPNCVELDSVNRKALEKKGFKVLESIKHSKTNFDAIFSSNVLEHIKDDEKAILEICKKLNKNGYLFLFLPAFQMLFSDMDKKVGHFRRYNMNDLKKKIRQANLEICYCNYFDSLGFFASLLMKVTGYNHKKGIGSKDSLIFYDKYVTPISFFLDKLGIRFLFGKNIILLAKKWKKNYLVWSIICFTKSASNPIDSIIKDSSSPPIPR